MCLSFLPATLDASAQVPGSLSPQMPPPPPPSPSPSLPLLQSAGLRLKVNIEVTVKVIRPMLIQISLRLGKHTELVLYD